MADVLLIKTLVVILASAACISLVARAGLPAAGGYLLAGLIIGPHGLHLIATSDETRFLAELGIIFLMFMVGLEFSLPAMIAARRDVFVAGSLQVGLTALIVAGILSGAMTSEPRPRKLQVWALGILVLLGLWRAPVLAGRSRAARDASPQLSALPFVVGPTAPADSGWRLVGILDRKFLMMKPALRREDRRFRVTETFDAYTTTATR